MESFGRYQLISKFATGGMAELYKARLTTAAGAQKIVCIKRISPKFCQNPEFVALFLKEAHVALPLSHSNIAQVFDFGEVNGTYFLAMEYVRGRDLATLLDRAGSNHHKLDVAPAIFIAAEVAKALRFAHDYGVSKGGVAQIVHRDVSPHNVLLSYEGEVKLTDFGIALVLSQTAVPAGPVRGKPWYVAPEVLLGKTASALSDQYALGVVLYEMITGKRPHSGETEAEILQKVRQGAAVPMGRLVDGVPDEVIQIVTKAMDPKPSNRFVHIAEMGAALVEILHQRWPGYGTTQLAALMQQYFSPDLIDDEVTDLQAGANVTRDYLVEQLKKAGIVVDNATSSTGELLDMGTVAMTELHDRDKRHRPWHLYVLGAGAVLILGAALFWFVATMAPRSEKTVVAAPPSVEVTKSALTRSTHIEHLVPKSLVPVAAPVADVAASQPSAKKLAVAGQQQARIGAPATLNCNSWPWSIVYLNGRRLEGNTPLYGVSVPAGKHRLKFVNPELSMAKEVVLNLSSGQSKTVVVSLEQ